jgi:predicted transglutaminase-like cysteine proteinase
MTLLSGFINRIERNKLGELLVQKGHLSPSQLRLALKHQKQFGGSFGQILKDMGIVSQSRIRKTLLEQMAYRGVAACLTVFIGLSTINIGQANANTTMKSQFQNQAMVHKAAFGAHRSLNNGIERPQQLLFGSQEIASADISAFTKWTDALAKLDHIQFADSKLDQFRNMSVMGKVTAVNDYVNNFRYIEDQNNFGKSDYWASPTEFFARGGDCEDFAIAKYALLKQLGVSESQMRLAIVHDKIKNIPHAVLIVYTDNGPMLLDNQMKTTKLASSVDRYKPIYSINAVGWWRHVS